MLDILLLNLIVFPFPIPPFQLPMLYKRHIQTCRFQAATCLLIALLNFLQTSVSYRHHQQLDSM